MVSLYLTLKKTLPNIYKILFFTLLPAGTVAPQCVFTSSFPHDWEHWACFSVVSGHSYVLYGVHVNTFQFDTFFSSLQLNMLFLFSSHKSNMRYIKQMFCLCWLLVCSFSWWLLSRTGVLILFLNSHNLILLPGQLYSLEESGIVSAF